MLTVYGDCSGSERSQRAIVVACWMNSGQYWVEFDEKWKSFLSTYDVPYHHMREFAHSVGPYKHMKGKKAIRDAFMAHALRIIEETGCRSFATVVDSAAFNAFQEREGSTHNLGNGYLFAARACLSMITGWCNDNRQNEPTEYIFEQGDPRQDLLRRITESDGLPEPIFRSKICDDPRRSILPLQASDLLAYELLKGYRDIGRRQLRHPLKELDRMAHQWGIYDESNIEKLIPVGEATKTLEAIKKSTSARPT